MNKYIYGGKTILLVYYNLARSNPDELLNGFIPVWAIVIYIISGKICLYCIYLSFIFMKYLKIIIF